MSRRKAVIWRGIRIINGWDKCEKKVLNSVFSDMEPFAWKGYGTSEENRHANGEMFALGR